MKQVLLTQKGGPQEAPYVIETTLPEPTAGQVRVKVLASGVAFADVMMRRARLARRQGLVTRPAVAWQPGAIGRLL